MDRRSAFDNDAERGIEDLQRTKKTREMSTSAREKRRRDMERVRGRYDMLRVVKDWVAKIAKANGISHSMAASLLLAHALRQYGEGEISFYDITKNKTPSPKYTWAVPDDEILAVLEGEKEL